MFKQLRHRLAGVLTFEDMTRRSENYIEDTMNSEEQRKGMMGLSPSVVMLSKSP